jgi:hypothetical protein
LYLAGYRVTDPGVRVKEIGEVKPSLKITKIHPPAKTMQRKRVPQSVSLGCHVEGAVPPKPDPDPISLACGLQARLGWQRKPLSRFEKRKLKRFVHKWVRKNLKPIDPTTDLSFETWIASQRAKGTYSSARCDELEEVWELHRHYIDGTGQVRDWSKVPNKMRRKIMKCKSFCKEEHYEGWKHPRAINSRSDFFKCLVGPIFEKIGDAVFHYSAPGEPSPFIKLVPVRDRPQVVKTHLQEDGAEYNVTDYSSFEAHFDEEFLAIIEFELYKWMTSRLGEKGQHFMMTIDIAFTNQNQMTFKAFTSFVRATRMSGEMNTSLGNGFANMILAEYLVWCKDPNAKLKGFFEGDDGLFTVTPKSAAPTAADYQRLGCNMKEVLIFTDLGEASFCGMLFHPEDPDLTVVTNPLKVLAKTGWGSRKYVNANARTRNALLRNKGYSVAHCYRGCPILDSFGAYLLRVTYDDKDRIERLVQNFSWWERNQLIDRSSATDQLRKTPHRLTRELVERLYGITEAVQLEVEDYLDSLDSLQPLRLDMLAWPKEWTEYYTTYAMPFPDDYNCIGEHGIHARELQAVKDLASKNPTFGLLRDVIE